MPQNSFKFDKNTFAEFEISRISVLERGQNDWVAFMWSKHGQEAVGRGEHMLEALDAAVSYLTNSFRLPPSLLRNVEASLHPQVKPSPYSIKRNKNNRLLSMPEQILQRFSDKKAEMEVRLPNKEFEEAQEKTDVLIPVGYSDIQGAYTEVTVRPATLQSLRDQFDSLSVQEYSGEKRYLLWIKTMAGRIQELCPFDLHRGAVVGTGLATGKYTTFYYFQVGKIDRDIVITEAEPVVVNFSRHENFQVQLYGMNKDLGIHEQVKKKVSLWNRIDLDDE